MRASPFAPLPIADLAHARAVVGAKLWQQLRGKRLLLTGGTGFVGKWLLATLLDAEREFGLGCDVTVLSRDPDAFAAAAPDLAASARIQLLRGDVRSFEFPAGNCDAVVHAATDVVATNKPLDTFDTCVSGTRRALEYAVRAGATDFLLISSGAVYGRQPPTLMRLAEDHVGAPSTLAAASAYGEGKRVSEWLACAYASEHPLRVKIARCFAFVGPYLPLDKHFAIGNFLRDAMAGQPIVIQGDGTPYRSYLHAADMAGWLWAILLQGAPGTAYNVGGAEAVSIAELAHRVVRIVGSKASVTTMKAPSPDAPAERYLPCVDKVIAELGLPAPLPLDEAIRRTALWHQDSRQTS